VPREGLVAAQVNTFQCLHKQRRIRLENDAKNKNEENEAVELGG